MKKNVLKWMFFSICCVSMLTACSDSDSDGGGGSGDFLQTSCFVINQGVSGMNNASMQQFDILSGLASSPDCNNDVFYKANGELLGDVAQDLLCVGNKVFVTVSNSQKLEILDDSCRRVRKYTYAGEGACPRCLATDGSKVYVTNYDGYVYVYDVASGDSLTRIYSGSYPEGISYCNGYLVVNNSNWGGYGGGEAGVAVINVASGESKIIKEGVCNPYTQSVVCGGEVYIIDSGNYSDILPAVYRVDADNAKLVKVAENASLISSDEGAIYYVNASWSYAINGTSYSPLYKLVVATGEKFEILPTEKMKDISSLDVNPENGDIYIGYSPSSEYFGTMRIYDFEGKQKGVFEVGYFTSGARFY
ncbi:MAG: hypothetical protein IKC70_05995 [Bacteroidaceae bacterium]|nr:hypothetical protein [Bacteroidaceae bacterium]